MWYIYQPHWVLPERFTCGVIKAAQATYVKATTALSWELSEEEKFFIRSGAELEVRTASEVSSPRERARHAGSAHHLEVSLTPASMRLVESMHRSWFLYYPHWHDMSEGHIVARQSTCLKRSMLHSRDLPEHEKVVIAEGERLAAQCEPEDLRPLDGMQGSVFAAAHREVKIPLSEVLRLQAKAPRQPLCKYFSSEREELHADIKTCFTDAKFGPGVPARVLEMGSNCALTREGACSPPALLLPHGGYCNSGFVAAHGFSLLLDCKVSVAIIIGNNHAAWNKFALCDQVWATPFGVMEPESSAVTHLDALGYKVDRNVHCQEHSIENQLPFLQYLHPEAQILPVGVGAVSLSEAQHLASDISRLAARPGTVLMGTTDFSHEGPSYGGPSLPMDEITALTREKDAPLLKAVSDMDAQRLLELGRSSSMCGAGAAAVFLLTCKELGLTQSKMLRYLVNTEVTPCGSTTGFASFAFTTPTV